MTKDPTKPKPTPPAFSFPTGLGADPYGAYFPDLPSNVAGSFIMGLAAASSTLALGTPKPVAALPPGHPWQGRPELHIGLRTGFCGSLTTLSSWALALTQQLVGGSGRRGGRWTQWLWGWFVGGCVALASYAAGEHLARLLDDRGTPPAARAAVRAAALVARAPRAGATVGVPARQVDVESGRLVMTALASGGVADPEAAAAGGALARDGEVILPLRRLAAHVAARPPTTGAGRAAVASDATERRRAADKASTAEGSGSGGGGARRRGGHHAHAPPPRLPSPPAPEFEESLSAGALAAKVRVENGEADGGSRRPAHHHHAPPLRDRVAAAWETLVEAAGGRGVAHSFATKTNAVVTAAGLAVFAASIALTAIDGHPVRRGVWTAVLAAPLGALTRWRLSPLNYRLPGAWRFLPAGTLAANVGGCLLTCAVAAWTARVPPGPGSPSAILAAALQIGVAGSLSTVSTLAAEATAMLRQAPADASGYAYLAITWAAAVGVGVLVYGVGGVLA